MKTKKEITKETVEFYAADPTRRAFTTKVRYASNDTDQIRYDSCEYHMEKADGTIAHCAVGRCLKHPEKVENCDAWGLVDEDESIDDLLKPEYRGHSILFWSDLQGLHDGSNYWQGDGLTEKGWAYIKKHFNMDPSDFDIQPVHV